MAKGKKQSGTQRRRAQGTSRVPQGAVRSGAKPPPPPPPRTSGAGESGAGRLGSGAGIAAPRRTTSGGPSRWTWIVGAGVVVVVAVIAVAVVLSQRGGSGQPAVVTDRLSHDTLDPVSRPTWVANYTDLGPALKALGFPGPSQAVNHYHAHITLYVNGRRVTIPANIGLSVSAESPVHTHTSDGIIHIEADDPTFRPTLGEVFDIWGVDFTDTCVGGYCDGVKVWVNGKPVPDPTGYKLQKHDAVTVVEGSPPPGFEPDQSYEFPAGL